MSERIQSKSTGPIVAEVFGLPGTGKSTLASRLCATVEGILPVSIYLTSPGNMRLAAPRLASIWRLLLGPDFRSRRAVREILWMLRLEIFEAVLDREATPGASVLLLEPGPVYTMARLVNAKPSEERSPRLDSWWSGRVRAVRARLDLLIVLDAPDEVALERIRGRAKPHYMRDIPLEEARRHISRERRIYDEIRADLASQGIPMLRFDTSRQSLELIAEQTLTVLHS
jgi:cytidylate kinase